MSDPIENIHELQGGVQMNKQIVMLKLTELLLQEQLISPDEKVELRKLINGGEDT